MDGWDSGRRVRWSRQEEEAEQQPRSWEKGGRTKRSEEAGRPGEECFPREDEAA